MVDHPILFSAPMIHAILREIDAPGTGKTQTRRIITPQPFIDKCGNFCAPDKRGEVWNWGQNVDGSPCIRNFIPAVLKRRPGDRLWVREAWRCNGWASDVATIFYRASEGYGYTAMCEQIPVADHLPLPVTGTWRPSIHLPRWASRLTLYVTEVRVQRLQEISEADAIAEGTLHQNVILDVKCYGGQPIEIIADRYWNGMEPNEFEGFESASEAYADLWDQINGAGAWDANPWVVAYTFTPRLGNIDTLPTRFLEAA